MNNISICIFPVFGLSFFFSFRKHIKSYISFSTSINERNEDLWRLFCVAASSSRSLNYIYDHVHNFLPFRQVETATA